MKRAIAIYSIFLGLSVIGLWLLLLCQGVQNEGRIELGFHLYSEFSMALICIIGGILFLKGKSFAIETMVGGHAMIIYSTLNAAGYYGEKRENSTMLIFVALFMISVICIATLYKLFTGTKKIYNENRG